MSRWTLGLGGSTHEFSAALMRGNDIVVAIEEERLTRRKRGRARFFEDPVERSIEYCLDTAGISLSHVDSIVSSDLLPARVRSELRGTPLKLYPHHLCHAASAYVMAPERATAAILVYDGIGSILSQEHTGDALTPLRNVRETFSFYRFSPEEIACLGQTVGAGFFEHDDFPSTVDNSLGKLYELITAILGFGTEDAGKTMGLAAYGVPSYYDLLMQFVGWGDSASSCFSCTLGNPALRHELRKVLGPDLDDFRVRANLAASIQAIANETLVRCMSVFDMGEYDVICLAGGCALNTVATSHLITRSVGMPPVLVPPYANDAGLAFGALYLDARERSGGDIILTFNGQAASPALARPGRLYTKDECMAAANRYYPRVALDSSVCGARELAARLASGSIIGCFNGRSEMGPRALGGRSLLADPRRAGVRETINRKIKQREPFRPLAPIVLESEYAAYFDDPRLADPFMLKVAHATELCRRDAPAVVHADGTARVQIVNDDTDPFLVELLTAFRSATGVPMLLNTSFNRRGEPIVETPAHAFEAFLAMELDGLFVNGMYFFRQD